MNQFVIIAAQGRSGSTTLMRILNTLPNTSIRGENNAAIQSLVTAYEQFKYADKQSKGIISAKVKPAWLNTFSLAIVKKNIIDLIQSVYQSDKYKIWGYKEIRFDTAEKIAQISTFKELFPGIKVIFLYKQDLARISVSGWWKDQSEAKEILTTMQNEFIAFNKAHPDYTYILTFEDMLAKNSTFANLFAFLGSEYNMDKIEAVLKNNLE